MASNLIAVSGDQDPRPGQALRLTSLSPRFDGERHQLYYDLLVRAIDAGRTFNVALTGSYGTGKSSILDQLRSDRPHSVVDLSLSTIAPEAHEAGEHDGENASTGAESRTNRIQKEIVKQLLYRVPTSTVPRSGFRRTSVPDRARRWFAAVRWGLLISGAIFVLGLVQPLVESFFAEVWRQAAAYALLTGVVVSGAWVVASLLRSRPSLTASVKTGPATVTLSKASETYFDEYLDEIVYFFQASKRDVVLIEDIDRFEDVQVFDTLRSLNSLLNSSDQIGRRIVFIYAIRDSVFEQIGAGKKRARPAATETPGPKTDRAKVTLERANRTKFFDVIIPVVPFVSADNARDVMSEAMASTEFEINPALIRLAARHVADMRLIHNIRNEFEVYRSRLVVPNDRVPGINDDLVFAIVLFKNTHLADFEKIRHQDSSLDRLYQKWRDLVNENLHAANQKATELRQTGYLERTADARAAHLGERLLEFISTLGGGIAAAAGSATARLAEPATQENAKSRETWERITSGENQQIVIGTARPITMSFTADQLANLLATSIDRTEWKVADLGQLEREIAEVDAEITFLRHHTWEELCEPREPTLRTSQSSAALTDKSRLSKVQLSFDEIVERELESDLARALVRHGFITSHFALYTSSYYGAHLGPAAMEYISRCIEPGTPDASFELSEDDVVQILREQGADKKDDADLFNDSGVYNVGILDHLLTQRRGAAGTVARRLSHWGEEERRFVDTYMTQGTHPAALLAAMTPTWPVALGYAALEAPVDPSTKVKLLNAVLWALPNSKYAADEAVREFVEGSYRDMDSITHPGSTKRANIVLRAIGASGAVLESVEPLDSDARDLAISLKIFPVTEENLRVLVSSDSIELDVLDKTDFRLYRYAVERLADYLDAFKTSALSKYTVKRPMLFSRVLIDAAATSASHVLHELIVSASPACRVRALTDVPHEVWQLLVDDDRTDPTFDNIRSYVAIFGVDTRLSKMLTKHKRVTGASGEPLGDRVKIAVAVLSAGQILRTTTRVSVAASLEPGQIPATSIMPERGDLVARLLKKGLLADDPTAFSSELMIDWPTFEATIKASEKFYRFVSPDILNVSQIPHLLRSTVVPVRVSSAVVSHLAEYLDGASPVQVQEVARALNEYGSSLTYEQIEALRAAGAHRGTLAQLIADRADELPISELKALLHDMGAEYSQIADGGRGRPAFLDDRAHRYILNRLLGDTIKRVEPKDFKVKGHRLVAHLAEPGE